MRESKKKMYRLPDFLLVQNIAILRVNKNKKDIKQIPISRFA